MEVLCAADQRIVYLCGAGTSIALSGKRLSWPDWIRVGKKYLLQEEQTELERRIGNCTASELSDAAGFLFAALKRTGNYRNFMETTVGSLRPVNQALIEAIQGLWRSGDLFATTNYDLTLEYSVGAKPVSYCVPGEVLSVIQGQSPGRIIHLHGVFHPGSTGDGDEIVATDQQYEKILENSGAQFVQNLMGTYPVVIVGCGATLQDFNLSGFMRFLTEQLGRLDVPYFYLMKKGDTPDGLPANALPVVFGDGHEDLPHFLREMALIRLRHSKALQAVCLVNPYTDRKPRRSAFARMHFGSGFNAFVGRDHERHQMDCLLDPEEKFLWWTFLGAGGIGKSRLILEWMRDLPADWFGFFCRNDADAVHQFKPFADTVVALDDIVGQESEWGQVVQALIECYSTTRYKLRIIFIERNLPEAADGWLHRLLSLMDAGTRLEFEECRYQEPIKLEALSPQDEILYVKRYLESYLPTLEQTEFICQCNANLDALSQAVQKGYRETLDETCWRPLFLNIYTESWIAREGRLSVASHHELLKEYVDRERQRWIRRLSNETLADAYLRVLAVACAIGRFDISDVRGPNYLQGDCQSLVDYLDKQSGKPGAGEGVEDLFACRLERDEGDQPIKDFIQDIFGWDQQADKGGTDGSAAGELAKAAHFAVGCAYIKLRADPDEVYLQMLAGAGGATPEQLEELSGIRYREEQRLAVLPDHDWVIEPDFPAIIKNAIVEYVVHERDAKRFALLARSNSVMKMAFFVSQALQDRPNSLKFQTIAVTPPEQMLNYAEYYFGLLPVVDKVQDLAAVEQVLLASAPIFRRYERQLWLRIAIELERRGDAARLYESACRYAEYEERPGKEGFGEQAVDVLKIYCVGLHNARADDWHAAYLQRIERLMQDAPRCSFVEELLAEHYMLLANFRLYQREGTDFSHIWERTAALLHRCCVPAVIDNAMEAGRYCMIGAVRKGDFQLVACIASECEAIRQEHGSVEAAELAASSVCNLLANPLISRQERDRALGRIDRYYKEYPQSRAVRRAYVVAARNRYTRNPGKKQVPGDLLDVAKAWSLQYPDEIEFQEAYFALVYFRCQYAIAHTQFVQIGPLLQELTAVADRVNFEEYRESNWLRREVEKLKLGLSAMGLRYDGAF